MRHSSAPAPHRRLIVATGNPGKLREFRALLVGLPFALESLADLGVAAPEETGATFLANAELKARHAAAAIARAASAARAAIKPDAAGTPDAASAAAPTYPAATNFCDTEPLPAAALADDSGLEVDALGGAPGVFSARYAGVGADDVANNAKLVAALTGVPKEARRARYRCALVLVFSPEDTQPVVAEGVWEGYILDAPLGTGGFGYDPYFWLPDLGVTAAQLDPAQKNRLSHRGMALRSLRAQLVARNLLRVQG